jgi:hypothetical protein
MTYGYQMLKATRVLLLQAAIRLPLIVLCASVMNLAFIYAVALRQIFEVRTPVQSNLAGAALAAL